MIKPGKIWHSPANVYWHIQQLSKKVGEKNIEANGRYQNVREARIGAVVALAMFERTGKPAFIQLYKPDPPDVVIMQPSNEVIGQRDITQLEITGYLGKPKESLLDQLKRTKVPPGRGLFSENYILLVNLGVGLQVDYKPIRNYLNENKTRFPIWVLQEKEAFPDTIARLVIANPELVEIEINIGKAMDKFESLSLPGVIHSKRVGNTKLVRAEPREKSYKAPWETSGK
jgi:hypothetical protein